jgi:hypothetical protein
MFPRPTAAPTVARINPNPEDHRAVAISRNVSREELNADYPILDPRKGDYSPVVVRGDSDITAANLEAHDNALLEAKGGADRSSIEQKAVRTGTKPDRSAGIAESPEKFQ